jgi:hypothetical protein
MPLVLPQTSVLFVSKQGSPHATLIQTELASITPLEVLKSIDFQDIPSLSSSPENQFDTIVSVSSESSHHSQSLILEYWRVLKPQGTLKLLERFDRSFEHSSSLSNALTLSGFSQQSNTNHGDFVMVTVTKPNYTTGAKHAIKLKKKPVKDAWSEESEGGALIDENSLLSASDLAKPVLTDDCEVGATKKACKNCSCGRAEMEEGGNEKKAKVTLAMLENPAVNSSCGSCALGDAFRCGGCPYKGLPAFKPGEKIVLPDDFDMDLIDA